ncbi:MAG: hypothetical protein ABIJ00_07265 [Candidatus Eisenbacteria bacterium]
MKKTAGILTLLVLLSAAAIVSQHIAKGAAIPTSTTEKPFPRLQTPENS